VADAVQGAAAVEDVALGTDSGVLADYPLVGGLPPAETMALARLRLPAGTPVVIGAAKYVPAGLHQRWLKAEFEGGTAAMNFERRELELGFDGEKLYFGLSRAVNYATQWRVFEEKVLTPDLPIEYAISLRALRLALALREMGLARGIKPLRLGDRAIARIRTVIDRPSDLLSLSEALGG